MQLDKNTSVLLRLLIVLALILPWFGTGYAYLALIAIFCYSLFFKNTINSKIFSLGNYLYFMPFLIFVSWLYGVSVGLIAGHPVSHVFSNFFGLSFYLIFYALDRVRLNNNSVVQVVFISALVVFIYDSWIFISDLINGGVFSVVANSISDYRVKYDPAVLYFSPFILYYLICSFSSAKLISKNNVFMPAMRHNLTFLGFSIIFIFLSMSKGIILVFALLLVFSLAFGFYNFLFNFRIRWEFLIALCILIFAVIALSDFFVFLASSFGKQEESNSVRDMQLSLILDEFSLIGSGLGAPLRSGYFRSEELPYGFELTYFNIIHKLGIFSIFLFLSYLAVIFEATKFLFKTNKISVGIFVLGLMSYLVVGYGNPILLSPNFVLVHVLCMILLKKNINKTF